MNAYLTLTTLWKTPAELLGAAPFASSDPAGGGAFALCVALTALAAVCVAARVLVRRAERRVRKRLALERRARRAERAVFRSRHAGSRRPAFDDEFYYRDERPRRRASSRRTGESRGERRRIALTSGAFGALIAAGILTLLRGPAIETPDVKRTNDASRLAENDENARFGATGAAFRNVADSEGTRWVDATVGGETGLRRVEETVGNAVRRENAPTGRNSENNGNGWNGENRENGRRGGQNAANGSVDRVENRAATRLVETAGPSGETFKVEQIRAESNLSVPAPEALPSGSAYSTDWNAATVLPTQGPSVADLAAGTPNAERGALQEIPNAASATEKRAPVANENGNDVAAAFVPTAPLIPFPSDASGEVALAGYEARAALSLLERIDDEFHRIGARVKTSVLAIETQKRSKKTTQKSNVETGCGFLFQYKGKVYLATNMHVVADAVSNKSVKIFLPNGSTINPTRILTCDDFDLAALEIDAARLPQDGSATLCHFGDSDELRVSNFVGTVGNPFGLDQTVTYGHVSSIRRRRIEFDKSDKKSLQEFVQIDAAINPGNSGGPLYNARGEVVGVVAAIATTTGKNEGVAFAIPINVALRALKMTIDAGGWNRSRMGVVLEPVADGTERTTGRGSKIMRVDANSPAEKAGLRDGDVVVEYDGETVEDDLHLARLIALTDVSETPVVKFRRDDQTRQTTARLERSVVR